MAKTNKKTKKKEKKKEKRERKEKRFMAFIFLKNKGYSLLIDFVFKA